MREVIRTMTLYGRTYALIGCASHNGNFCNECAFLRSYCGEPVCVGGQDAQRWCIKANGHLFIELPGERGSE
jgi:hypothetical protein